MFSNILMKNSTEVATMLEKSVLVFNATVWYLQIMMASV